MRSSSTTTLSILFFIYAVALMAGVFSMPLRLDEILQVSNPDYHAFKGTLDIITQTPGAAPLNYLIQYPFIHVFGHSRLAVRIVSLLFAIGALWLFWKVSRSIPLRNPELASATFAALPLHYLFAVSGRPYEQALFLLVLSIFFLLRLIARPRVASAAYYSGTLLLLIYTEPLAFWPAVGFLLFFLRFIRVVRERRVFWHLLPATAIPAFLYLPYYIWVTPRRSPEWLYPISAGGSSYLQAFEYISAAGSLAYLVSALLLIATAFALWRSFRLPDSAAKTRIALFCLFGGAVSALAGALIVSTIGGSPVRQNEILWIAPQIILLTFAALDWPERREGIRLLSTAAGAVLLILCTVGCMQYVGENRNIDVEAVADRATREIRSDDACVVLVSERLSPRLFLLFQPELKQKECVDFLHKQVVLAIHPFVLPEQQQDAETFFRGLNFEETKRIRIKGGEIIDMNQKDTTRSDILITPK